MRAGEVVALVSDAGTPGVSDPGARLVSAALDRGVQVESLPGPSALLAALTVSGLPMERFYFGGFLPRKAGERKRRLEELSELEATLVFFESPRRAARTLQVLAEVLSGREAALVRELTKIHEEVVRGPLGEVAQSCAERELKGEVVLIVGPPLRNQTRVSSHLTAAKRQDVVSCVEALVAQGMTPTTAVKHVAKESGIDRGVVYDLVNRR
jgi:16S rRNA (cytidine1402-2'-O)-methyltransferase